MLAAWQTVACDGVITFTSANARLQLSTSYTFTSRKIVLDASGLSTGVTLLAAPASRHFYVTGNNANFTAKAITFQNGRLNYTTGNALGGSMAIEFGASGLFEDCVFQNNSVSGRLARGGVLYAYRSANLVWRRCVVRDNFASSHVEAAGGAMFIVEATVPILLISSRFIKNRIVVSEADLLIWY